MRGVPADRRVTVTGGDTVVVHLCRRMLRLGQVADALESDIARAGSPRKAAQLQRRAAHRRLWADRIRDHLREEAEQEGALRGAPGSARPESPDPAGPSGGL